MSDKTAGLCRITVRSPEKTFELGIPADVPLADLLPVLVEYLRRRPRRAGPGTRRLEPPAARRGPLDEERTPASLELRDGETLYLRARHETLPEADFDDLVDGIGETLRARPDTWRPELTRRLLIGFTVAALAAGLITVLLPGAAMWRAGAAAAVALLLVAGGLAASRAVGDAGAGAALGVLAVPYLAVAGALVPAAGHGESMLGPRLLAGGAAGAGAAIIALAAVGAFAPLFLGAFTVAVFVAAAGAIALTGIPSAHVAALAGRRRRPGGRIRPQPGLPVRRYADAAAAVQRGRTAGGHRAVPRPAGT